MTIKECLAQLSAEDLAYVAQLRANGEKVIGINELGEVTVGE